MTQYIWQVALYVKPSFSVLGRWKDTFGIPNIPKFEPKNAYPLFTSIRKGENPWFLVDSKKL
jgi:hypothetical protein